MARTISVKYFDDARGRLTVAEPLPFAVNRVFWIDKVPRGISRGGHAHIQCEQLLFAVQGGVNVEIHDGRLSQTISLGQSSGLYLPALHWVDLTAFVDDAILLVAASHPYSEADNIRDFAEFCRLVETHG